MSLRYEHKLKIADIIITLQSSLPLETRPLDPQIGRVARHFETFLYKGKKKTDINIKIRPTARFRHIHKPKKLFTAYHFQDGNTNWEFFEKDGVYIYESTFKEKKQMLINNRFDRVEAHLFPDTPDKKSLRASAIVYDFLQVLLINYLAQRDLGIVVHSAGVRDVDGRGLLFPGKSGCGKSTTAQLWHTHTRATVLNDDRVVIRRDNGKFFLYTSPWHGGFRDYRDSSMRSAPLTRIFFLYHSPRNVLRRISKKDAFNSLYSSLFTTFWDKGNMEKVAIFCQDLVNSIPCYNLGFVNNKEAVHFVRKHVRDAV
jgi:hypothetical protein